MPRILQPVKSSISARIIILLVVCLTSIIVISSTISYLLQRQELVSKRDIHATHSVERLAFSMSPRLWNFDLEQLEMLATAEIKSENAVGVLVWTPDGRLLLEKMRDPADSGRWSAPGGLLSQGKQPPRILVVRQVIRRDQQALGTVQIIYDNRQVDKVLDFLLVQEACKALVLILVTSVVLYLGLSRVLLGRLKTVYVAARVFATGNLSGRLKVDATDEIGALSTTFNQMADRISDKISQLETAYDEVRQLKGMLDDIINSLPSIIVVTNREGMVDLWNKQAEQFTGIAAGMASGRPVDELLPQFAPCLQHAASVLDLQRPYIAEKHTVHVGGEQMRYSVQLFPLVSQNNSQLVIRIDDITEYARLEEVMVQNEKMTMVGGLAAGMAHEINNPLAAMMQNAQNIERRLSPDLAANEASAREAGISLEAINAYLNKRGIPGFLTHIRDAGARIAKIITTMLRFSSKSESRREAVSLETVMEQTLELAASDYDMKKLYDFASIEIIRDYDPLVSPVQITISEIEHVLLNILKNAAQAASSMRSSRPPRITMRTRQEGQMSLVEIEDNGPGMSETVQRRIFEPFYSTRDVGQGTGLGLSVAYAIISNSYHGRIYVESRAGEGTCFTVSIPCSGGGL